MSVARSYDFHRRCYVDHIEPAFETTMAQRPATSL
jgi:hypothetical protein